MSATPQVPSAHTKWKPKFIALHTMRDRRETRISHDCGRSLKCTILIICCSLDFDRYRSTGGINRRWISSKSLCSAWTKSHMSTGSTISRAQLRTTRMHWSSSKTHKMCCTFVWRKKIFVLVIKRMYSARCEISSNDILCWTSFNIEFIKSKQDEKITKDLIRKRQLDQSILRFTRFYQAGKSDFLRDDLSAEYSSPMMEGIEQHCSRWRKANELNLVFIRLRRCRSRTYGTTLWADGRHGNGLHCFQGPHSKDWYNDHCSRAHEPLERSSQRLHQKRQCGLFLHASLSISNLWSRRSRHSSLSQARRTLSISLYLQRITRSYVYTDRLIQFSISHLCFVEELQALRLSDSLPATTASASSSSHALDPFNFFSATDTYPTFNARRASKVKQPKRLGST